MAQWAAKLGEAATPRLSTLRGASSAALLCALGEEHGAATRDLLAGTGIAPGALADPEAEITAAQELGLIVNVLAAVDAPEGLGLVAGRRYRLTTYGIWGFALLSSRTVRESHTLAMRFVDLTYALTRITAEESGGELALFFDDWDVDEPVRRFVLERDSSACVQAWREVVDQDIRPLRVELRLPEPARVAPFEEAFGVRPRFGAERSAVVFDAALLDRPLPQAAPLTAAFCETQCRELLERRQTRLGASGRVRDVLLRDPRRMPGQDEVAAALHVSVRTLRRQLQEEGTTFRAVVEETREHLAEELLATARLSVEQVAERVGYSEASSFVHAFRRWKGVSPRRWAQQQAA